MTCVDLAIIWYFGAFFSFVYARQAVSAINDRSDVPDEVTAFDMLLLAIMCALSWVAVFATFSHRLICGFGPWGDVDPKKAKDRSVELPPSWRPEVCAFADLMEKMLASKDAAFGRASWKKDLPEELLAKVLDHTDLLDAFVDEVQTNRGNDDPFDIAFGMATDSAVEQVVHIANYAMMIADVCGALELSESNQQAGAS